MRIACGLLDMPLTKRSKGGTVHAHLKLSPAILAVAGSLIVAASGTALAATATTAKAKHKKPGPVTLAQVDSQIAKLAPSLSVKYAGAAGTAVSAASATSAATATSAASAATATNATEVGGQTLVKIFSTAPVPTAGFPLFSEDGLTITAACDGANNADLSANGPAASELQVNGFNGGTAYSDTIDGFTGARGINAAGGSGGATLSYENSSGQVVTMTLNWGGSPSLGTHTGCVFGGDAFYS